MMMPPKGSVGPLKSIGGFLSKAKRASGHQVGRALRFTSTKFVQVRGGVAHGVKIVKPHVGRVISAAGGALKWAVSIAARHI